MIDIPTSGKLTIEPGEYRLREPLVISGREKTPLRVEAYGAVFVGHGVVIARQRTVIEGLTVRNAEFGLQMVRGQGSRFADCTMMHCKTGLLFSHRDTRFPNSQVAYSTFQNLLISGCRIGIEFDPVGKSWANANTFTGCTIRGGRQAIIGKSFANYNTFVGLQCEGNERCIDMQGSRATTFVGGHIVDGESIVGPMAQVFGGRWKHGIQRFHGHALCNVSTPKSGGLLNNVRTR